MVELSLATVDDLANDQGPYFIKGSKFTDCVALNQTFNSISAFEDEVCAKRYRSFMQRTNCLFSQRDIVISSSLPTMHARTRSKSPSTWTAAVAKQTVLNPFEPLATGKMLRGIV